MGPRRRRQELPLQSRTNLPSRIQPSKLVLRLAGVLFTERNTVHGEIGFRFTKRTDCHVILIRNQVHFYFGGIECQYFI